MNIFGGLKKEGTRTRSGSTAERLALPPEELIAGEVWYDETDQDVADKGYYWNSFKQKWIWFHTFSV